MSAAPPVHTATSRALLAWLDERIAALDVDEAHASDRGALAAYRRVRKELVDRLPYCEMDAIVLVMPGLSYTTAAGLLEMYDGSGPIDTAA